MTRSHPSMLVIAAGIATFTAAALAQTTTGSAERGRKAYVEKMCYTCHGYAGQGGERGSGPRLAPDVWAYDAFVQQVRRPRQDMPRYSAKFVSDQEIADIHAYLSAIKPGPKATAIPLLRE